MHSETWALFTTNCRLPLRDFVASEFAPPVVLTIFDYLHTSQTTNTTKTNHKPPSTLQWVLFLATLPFPTVRSITAKSENSSRKDQWDYHLPPSMTDGHPKDEIDNAQALRLSQNEALRTMIYLLSRRIHWRAKKAKARFKAPTSRHNWTYQCQSFPCNDLVRDEPWSETISDHDQFWVSVLINL